MILRVWSAGARNQDVVPTLSKAHGAFLFSCMRTCRARGHASSAGGWALELALENVAFTFFTIYYQWRFCYLEPVIMAR